MFGVDTPATRTLWFLGIAVLVLAATPLAAIEAADAPPAGDKPASPYSVYGQTTGLFHYASPDQPPTPYTGNTTWLLGLELHHHYVLKDFEARLDHRVDLSPGTSQLSLASIRHLVDEAYGLFHFTQAFDVFAGQKRLQIGLGSTFALGDVLNPRTGYWDQRTGFRGAGARLSVGDSFGVVAAVSAERVLQNASTEGSQLLYAAGFDWQLDKLNVAGGYTFAYKYTSLPTIGASWDFDGLIISAETAWEFMPQGYYLTGSGWNKSDVPLGSFAAGLRWQTSPGDSDIVLAADYAYLGQGFDATQQSDWNAQPAAIASSALSPVAKAQAAAKLPSYLPRPLRNRHYVVPTVSYTLTDKFSVKLNGLINLQDGSALLSGTFDLLSFENADLELASSWWLGKRGDELYQSALDGSRLTVDAGLRLHF